MKRTNCPVCADIGWCNDHPPKAGKTGEQVTRDIIDTMAASYLPEDDEPAPKTKAKTAVKAQGDRFWQGRRDNMVHDMVESHLLDMLELAGFACKTRDFRRQLKAFISKHFEKVGQ